MEDLQCQCSCKNIKFSVPYRPNEIAQCYCTICRRLHRKIFVSFAKYDKKQISLDFNKMKFIKSSTRAIRYKCSNCNDWICMIYNDSDNIWLEVDRFLFSCIDIETYSIYEDEIKSNDTTCRISK